MRFAPPFCLCLFACLALQARDLAAYRVGDVAEADIVTPVALDVVDTAATATLRSAREQQFPAVFRSLPEAANGMKRDFLAAFSQARTNFLADLKIEFHSAAVDETNIAPADFDRLVTVFGVENKNFPLTDELAAEWARGGDGHAIQEKLLATLEWAENRPVRPDALPKGMAIGETIRLVPVTDLDEKLSFESVQQGPLAPAGSLTTLSEAQTLFRREFSPNEQLFARALAAFLRPNCFPDAPFTELTRGAAVYKMIVSDHFDAGDVIVRRGDTIDAKIQATLAALNQNLMSLPAAPPVVAAKAEPPPKPQPTTMSAPAKAAAPVAAAPSPVVNPANVTPKTRIRHLWLIIALAGISAVSMLVAAWQYLKQRKRRTTTNTALVAQAPLPFPDAAKELLAPHVAQAVREAIQRELALQRRELLLAQQDATNEIAALVQRLDELQVPMQERLHTYEVRIQTLEKEIALRDEENRELLKLKIEMMSRQLKAERAASLMTSISA
jgi:hypothetical protein